MVFDDGEMTSIRYYIVSWTKQNFRVEKKPARVFKNSILHVYTTIIFIHL